LSIEQKAQKCNHQHLFFKQNYNSRSDTLDILHQDISIDFTQFSSNYISATAEIKGLPLLSNVTEIRFDLEGLIADSVFVNNTAIFYTQSPYSLIATLPNYSLGDTLHFRIHYSGYPINDSSWGGFYFQSGYAYNMGVGFDALPHNYGRVWHPCFDSFRERSTYSLHVKTQGNRTSYCGGLRLQVDTLGGDTLISHWLLNNPIPSYLASVAVANYTHSESEYTSINGSLIPIWLASKAIDTADFNASFVHLPDALTAFETFYGPYQWPRVGFTVVPFSGGAMEHATNIAYPLFAVNGNTQYETLFAHELSHHWWGDLITCERAEEMWINEGMASYSERVFLEYLYGYSSYSNSIRTNHKDVLLNAARLDGGYFPLANVPESVTYGNTVYNKGADFAHTLRGVMGETNFYAGIHDLMNTYAFGTINTIELRDFLQGYTSENLESVFDLWAFQPGYPDFRIGNWGYLPFNNNYLVTLNVEQYLNHATNFGINIPVDVQVIGVNNEIHNQRFYTNDIYAGEQSFFNFEIDFEPKHVFLNREDKIHYACLAEEQTVAAPGSHDLTFANTEFDIVSNTTSDSLWIRSELHLTSADRVTYLPNTEYVVSPDRCWYIQTEIPNGIETKTTLRFNGSAAATNALDTALFAEMQLLGLNETNLVLLHRAGSNAEWQEFPTATLFTSGSSTNWNGRFEIANIQPGYYAFAFKTGVIHVPENNNEKTCILFSNNRIRIPLKSGEFKLFSPSGQLIHSEKFSSPMDYSTSHLPTGTYIIQVNDCVQKLFIP
jgi:aminopeptidase N